MPSKYLDSETQASVEVEMDARLGSTSSSS
jgi:hypothetical protein